MIRDNYFIRTYGLYSLGRSNALAINLVSHVPRKTFGIFGYQFSRGFGWEYLCKLLDYLSCEREGIDLTVISPRRA